MIEEGKQKRKVFMIIDLQSCETQKRRLWVMVNIIQIQLNYFRSLGTPGAHSSLQILTFPHGF